jgi:hypothetical protein
MDSSSYANNAGKGGFGFMTLILVVAGLVAIYFLYSALYSAPSSNVVTLVPNQHAASEAVKDLPKIPTPFEGGDYTFSTWVYINSFNRNMNTPKHIFELKGDFFSTLLVGLGGARNTVIVRAHTKDLDTAAAGSTAPPPSEGGGSPMAGPSSDSAELSHKIVEDMFKPMAGATAAADGAQPQCDLAEIDLQRWVHLAVVMSGRTMDVYLDGKLARSCVSKSYFKVDPMGVKPVVCDRGGFDGYIANLGVANYAMNPGEIYRAYISGPQGASNDVFKWIGSLFTGASA